MAIDSFEFPLNSLSTGARRLGPSINAAATILTNFTGNEIINRNRSQFRRVFNATYGVRALAHLHILAAFYHAMGGPETGFLVKDWTDFQATVAATTLATSITVQGRSTLIPSTSTYQLEKWYTVGARVHKRKIKRPKSGTVTLSVGGTVDYDTGIVSGAGSAPDWTGEFFVPCRFAQKSLPADLMMYRANGTGFVDLPDVPMIEIL
jgi:uncharacterized protein (TIGR02217 family)